MGTERNRAQYEGLLIQDRRITTINATNSTATENSPQVGPITADTGFSTEALIIASGTPDDGDTLELIGLKGGSPGTNRAGFGWREDGATNWNGWDVPSVITDVHEVDPAALSTVGFKYPCPVAFSDGSILIMAGDSGPFTDGVSSRTRAVAGTYSATVNNIYSETKTTEELHPRCVLLESGRLLVYHFVNDLTNAEIQVRMMYTDDNGSTWTEGESGVLEDAIDIGALFVQRLRVVRSPDTGQYLMTVEMSSAGGSLLIRQFASRDGVYFEVVGDDQTILIGHDVVYTDGFFVIVHGNIGQCRRIGSAYSPISASVPTMIGNVTTTGIEANGWAAVVSDTGTIYVYGSQAMAVSDDAGATWNSGATELIRWHGSGCRHTNASGIWWRGRVYLVANQAVPAANVQTITAYWMGGYTDVTLPPERKTQNIGRQMFWQDTWVAQDTPASFFTDNSTGAPGVVLSGDRYVITNGAGDVAIYDHEAAATTAYIDVGAEAGFEAFSGTSSLGCRSCETSSPNYTEVDVLVSGTSIQMYDRVGASTLGSAATITSGAQVTIRIMLKGTNGSAWYSVHDVSTHVKTWTLLHTSSTLTESASAVTNRVRFSVQASSVGRFFWLSLIRDGENVATIGRSQADGITKPDHLFARSLPARGAAWVNDGVSIHGVDGPILRGVEMSMEITSLTPRESMLPTVQPSPRKVWKSASTTSLQKVAMTIATQDEVTYTGCDMVGIYIANCNASAVTVEALNSGGTWDVVTVILRATMSMAYIRKGRTVVPDETTTSQGLYYERDELVGSHFVLDGNSGDTRTIVGNTEGHWTSGATIAEKRCCIYLDGDEMDGTEATSGTTGYLVYRDSMTTINLLGSNDIREWRIGFGYANIDAPPSNMQAGIVMIGPMVVFGKRQDTEYTETRTALVEQQQWIDGSTSSRVLGPSYRTRTINFDDGVDVTTARGSQDPDYLRTSDGSGAEPIANTHDLPLMLAGLYDQLDGSHRHVVHVPNITRTISGAPGEAVTMLAGRAGGALYGRIQGVVTQTAVVGNPMLTEVLRGPSLTIREEV